MVCSTYCFHCGINQSGASHLFFTLCIDFCHESLGSTLYFQVTLPKVRITSSSYCHLGLKMPGSSLVLLLRPQQLAVMLMLRCAGPWLWLWMDSSRSPSDWLCVRSGLLWMLPVGELGAGWEEMVRSRWFLFLRKSLFAPKPKLPLRSTMRALLDLAGRERWLYSSWDKWAAYPSVMNCWEEKFYILNRLIDIYALNSISYSLVERMSVLDPSSVKCD